MIKQENLTINGRESVKTYSDNNKIIRKVGTNEEYTEAIDITTNAFTYEETEKQIEGVSH